MLPSLRSVQSRKILASIGLLGAAASIAGLGSLATFTDSTTADQAITTGTVIAQIGAAGSADNRLTIPVTNVAAGDVIERAVTLDNAGSLDWATASLSVSAIVSSALDTDAVNGLQMYVDSCSTAWVESGVAPAYTYACTGTQSSVIAPGPAVSASVDMGAVNALATGGTDYFRVTVELPSTADNTFQGLSSTLQFSFEAVQRASTNV